MKRQAAARGLSQLGMEEAGGGAQGGGMWHVTARIILTQGVRKKAALKIGVQEGKVALKLMVLFPYTRHF